VEDEEELTPQTPPPSSTPSSPLVCPIQVGSGPVEAAAVPPVVSKFRASNVVGVEEDKEELAPQSPRSAVVQGSWPRRGLLLGCPLRTMTLRTTKWKLLPRHRRPPSPSMLLPMLTKLMTRRWSVWRASVMAGRR
jgi:hypothetical protein